MLTRLARLTVAVWVASFASPAVAGAQDVLVDRVLAVVDGQLVTLSDLRAARALGFVKGADQPAALDALIDRLLVMGESSRYAVEEPSPAGIDARATALRESIWAPRVEAILREGRLSEEALRRQVRDDLVAAYMSQRFAATAMPTDTEVEAYVVAHRDELLQAAGSPASASDLARVARDRLSADRRAHLVADWVAGLRRRADISLKGVTP